MEQYTREYLEQLPRVKNKLTEVPTLTNLCYASIAHYFRKNPALVSSPEKLHPILDAIPLECGEGLLNAIQPIEYYGLKHIMSLENSCIIQGIVTKSRINPTKLIINTSKGSWHYSNRCSIFKTKISDDKKYVLLEKTKQLTLLELSTPYLQNETVIDASEQNNFFSVFHNDYIFYLKNKQLFRYDIKTKKKYNLLPSLSFARIHYLKDSGRLLLCDYNRYHANIVFCIFHNHIDFTFSLPKYARIEAIQSIQPNYDLLVTKSHKNNATTFQIFKVSNAVELQSSLVFSLFPITAFAHDKAYMALFTSNNIQIFNTQTGDKILTFPVKNDIAIKNMQYNGLLSFADENSHVHILDIQMAEKLNHYLQVKK